jgi:hypothetical protein
MMEGIGHYGMAMPLFMVEVAYSIVQQDFKDDFKDGNLF